MDAVSHLLEEALVVVAILAFPVLITATLVGTLVAIFQAATQIQEQTLAALPKIFAVLMVVATFGPAGMMMCANLLYDAVSQFRTLTST
jgi:flagellar biosynthesis protein FliQ